MDTLCVRCDHPESEHWPAAEYRGWPPPPDKPRCCLTCDCEAFQDEPTDDQLANRAGVEGGIGYPLGL